MSSVNNGGRQKRRSADGVWRSRARGYSKTRGTRVNTERLAVRLRRARLTSFAVGAVMGLAAMGGIAYSSYLPRFQIADIHIEGQSALSEAALRTVAESNLRDGRFHALSANSVLFFSRDGIEKSIVSRFPRVREVEASFYSYETPSIVVRISERASYARWCLSAATNQCFLLDENGFIFAPFADDVLAREIIFRGGMPSSIDPVGKQFLPSYFENVKTLVSSLENIGLVPSAVDVINDSDYHIILAGGTRLLFRFVDDPLVVAENLKVSLTSEALADGINSLEYIDMRFEGRVYYK